MSRVRIPDDAPASLIPTRIHPGLLGRLEETRKLPLETVCDALMAIARLGGHIKQNGEPGWMDLGRGCDKFLNYTVGYQTALAAMQNRASDHG